MGATSGIGMETAKCLAEKGWTVGIAGRRTERLQALEDSVDGIVCHASIDVTHPDAPTRLGELIDQMGGIDLYMHCSGIGWQNCELDSEKELLTVETNGTGFVRMIDAAFNWMSRQQQSKADGYSIACITSIAGTKGLGAAPAYSATKRFQTHYLESLTQLARMRHLRIGITDIRPGFVRTDLIAGSNYPLQMRPDYVAHRIVSAIENGRSVCIIDWRYRWLVALWQMLPRWLWTRLNIG